MMVTALSKIRLTEKAGDTLSANAHKEVTDWLATWTLRNNFKALLTTSREEAVRKYQALLQHSLLPGSIIAKGVELQHFEFELYAPDDVIDGYFWPPGSILWCAWHPVTP